MVDVVVIGAGLGGLGVAAMCARAGCSVLVCERNPYPGGYACDFGRKDVRFDASLHTIGGCAPGGITWQVLARCGVLDAVSFVRLPYAYRAIFPDLDVRVPAEPEALLDLVGTHFPAERAGAARCVAALAAVLREVTRFDDSWLPNWARTLLFPFCSPHTLRAARRTLGQQLAAHVRDPRCRGLLSQFWIYLGLPPSRLSALAFAPAWASYHVQGTFHLRATAASLARGLVAAAEARGATFRFRAPAERILIEGRRAAGVVLAGGETVRARVVVSNADARTTFTRLCDGPTTPLPPRFRARLAAMRPSISAVQVYCAYDRDLRADGLVDHQIFVNPTWDADAEWDRVQAGDFDHAGFGITVYTNMDPATPPGTGSVVTLGALAPYDHAEGWGVDEGKRGAVYGVTKRDVASIVERRAAAIAPALAAAPPRFREVATPLTLERYTGNTRGAMYGWENTPDQVGLSRLRRLPYRDLHLAGHWTFPGSGYAGALKSAEVAAARICTRLGRRPPAAATAGGAAGGAARFARSPPRPAGP